MPISQSKKWLSLLINMFDIPKLKKVIYLNFPARLILTRYLV